MTFQCIKKILNEYISGNKGAAGVSFMFEGTSLCFINAHLTSGHERNARYLCTILFIVPYEMRKQSYIRMF